MSLDEAPLNEPDRENNCKEGVRWKQSHHESSLLTEPWKPCQRSHAFVKEWLLKLGCLMGKVCGIEWYCYTALGILTAILSFLMDLSVTKLLRAHQWLYIKLEGNCLLQFFCWTLYPASLCAVAASFSHSICPFSTGSGVPEVRTMLAGIEMPHYLSLTNMFAKFLGLICTLAAGSTVFLGKVGPFVHLSTMLGAYLGNLCTLIQGRKEVRSAGEMQVVAAAVGVASCFGAPISGVLFSVEVMSSHFAVRDYCPCFFSAACGALTFRLLSVWSGNGETLQALFKTNFTNVIPFYPLEMLVFAWLGLLCGGVSCFFLFCHRWILRFTKTNPVLIKMLITEKSLYSCIVTFILATVTFPHSTGQYIAAKYTMRQLLTSLLDGRQWGSQTHNASVPLEPGPCSEWCLSGSLYVSLLLFLLMKLCMLVLACTLPLPAGYFMPVFIYGAALGRLVGEGLAYVCSTGLQWASVNPGGYALAGAAAFSGAATHSLSPALLVIELTGDFSHAIPVLIATLLANGLACSGHRPSFYDALSNSKRLPYLPSLMKACPQITSTQVGQVLGDKAVHLQKAAGSEEIQHAVSASSDTHTLPVVDSLESCILLGFVYRSELLTFLHHSGTEVLAKHLDEVCHIHPASVLVSPHCTLQEALWLLSLHGTQSVFVTERGKLLGLISWLEMKRILEDLAKEIFSRE